MTFRWIVLLTAILMVSLGCSGGRDTSHDVSEVPGGVPKLHVPKGVQHKKDNP